jgi:hypothetical protein
MRCSRYLSERHSDCEWTETHAQLLIMGGFQIVNEDGTLSILEESGLESITSSHPHILKIPVEEIKDRSKGDFIAKMVVVVQTLWFALQVINRVIQGHSVTELELTTLGHTVLNIFIYWCWWHKPLNVRFPFKVYPIEEKTEDQSKKGKSERQVDALEEPLVAESDRISPQRRLPIRVRLAKYIVEPDNTWILWQAAVWLICVIVFGGIFGAIHCLAWNAHFPTHIESKLWRASAVIVTAAPGTYILLVTATTFASDRWGKFHKRDDIVFGIQSIVISLVYALARICLLVLALLSLRALPYDAYVIASWTIYIPHI